MALFAEIAREIKQSRKLSQIMKKGKPKSYKELTIDFNKKIIKNSYMI